MDSSVIGKIDKAKRYASERDRISIRSLTAHFRGENSEHDLEFVDSEWKCNCNYFVGHGNCAHTMAMERVLEEMVPAPAHI
jgi:hypothetical protein